MIVDVKINLTLNQLKILIHHLQLSLPEVDEYFTDEDKELLELLKRLEELLMVSEKLRK
ncbi:hypothetical protein [Sphaerospermopsis sp. LEGE 08334]|uniref:hypothetical protein n=1 Tax=Sphaerospermopsis sp. LEGE 08334 TaxID=1828651 RepID=UPI00188090E3|nr:hypothetical protein [Sphaerospermopsis sp. LEGE 08334]MBE9059302.1 hypothetical protein [Sphaerospermopsis sp. LEGE 08334]